jgi:pimeloyl-ACP methyl ester carboxylesterase
MKDAIVEHGGYRIRVRTRGPARGPHALVLAGMGETAYTVGPQTRALRNLGYTTHVIELPGFGLAPALRKETARFTQLADIVLAVAKEIGVERALIFGHSLGGGIALHIAVRCPAFVAGLILLAPCALGRSLVWTYKLFCLPLIGRALLRPSKSVSRRYLRYFLIGSGRRDDERFIDRVLRRDRQGAAKVRSMRAIVWANQPPIWRRFLLFAVPGGEQLTFSLHDRVGTLRDIPTLVLWGSQDRVISARDAALIRRANPNAEVHVARGVGHLLPLEASEWTNDHIARFDALRLKDLHPTTRSA